MDRKSGSRGRVWSMAAVLLAGALAAPLVTLAAGPDAAKKKVVLDPVEIVSSSLHINDEDALDIAVSWPPTPKKYMGEVKHDVTLIGGSGGERVVIKTWDLDAEAADRGLMGEIRLPIGDPEFDPADYDELLVTASVRYDKGEQSALDYELASADTEPVGQDGGLDTDRCKVYKPGADLSGCTISGVNLSRADLHGVNLDNALISNGDWRAINLNGATMKAATINQMNFDRLSAGVCTQMEGAKVRNATLANSGFRHADLLNANFNGTVIKNASVDLTLAALRNTTMPDGSVVKNNGVSC